MFVAALTANLGIEISPFSHWSFDLPVWYSPYNITPERKLRLLAVQPEIRWWSKEAMKGHFIGLHTHVAGFNVVTKILTMLCGEWESVMVMLSISVK